LNDPSLSSKTSKMRVNFWAIIAHSVLKTAGFTEETVRVLSINLKKTGTIHPPTKRFQQKKE